MTTGDQTRGVRNNNPGNIRKSADKWQGLAEQQDDPLFFIFQSAPYGIRAIARILITHQDRDGCKTITNHINKWAPPNENNTGAYIAAVSKLAGYDPDSPLDMQRFAHLKALVRAIIMQECAGYQYENAVLTKGLVLAGVEPPQQDLSKSRTITGGQIATVTAAATAVTGVVQQAQDTLSSNPWIGSIVQLLVAHHPKILVGLSVATLAAVGYMIWARIDDHRRGLR